MDRCATTEALNKYLSGEEQFEKVCEDFECVWEMEVTNSMNTTKTYKPIERLFKYKGKLK